MLDIRQQLVDIKALVESAISQIDTENPPPPEWQVPKYSLANEAGYLNESILAECLNGDIICIYRKGSSHVSNGATLEIRRSTDRGITFGAPVTLQSVTNRDCRNHSVGVTPTGRLIVINRTTNGSTLDKRWKHISDDHGETWTTTEFNDLTAYPNHISFRKPVNTCNGLMQMFYNTNSLICAFSTDNGDTWGSPVVAFQLVMSSAHLAEPVVLRLDENRLVIVARDNLEKGRYWWLKSSDGGLTWTSPQSARYSNSAGPTAAPVSMIVRDSQVYFAWDGRAPLWMQWLSVVDKEAFFTNPAIAWQIGNTTTVSIGTSKCANGSATDGEFGYTDMLNLSEGVLRVWYDSKTGNGTTECEILVASV